jgi:CubicO group peptidase (beta-lactamase class C family)
MACDGLGSPVTCGGFNVSLSDFARIGLMFLNDGLVNGKQIVPASFVKDITETANSDYFAKGP